MPKTLFSMLKNKNIRTTEDFLKRMDPVIYKREKQKGTLPKRKSPFIRSRSSLGGCSSNFLDVEHQECTVRPHIHFLDQPEGEAAFIWPFAIKVPRCAGSCYVDKDILQCTGLVSSAVNVQAYKFSYSPSRRRRDVMQEFANLEEPIHEITKRSSGSDGVTLLNVSVVIHKKCDCKCTVTKQTCSSRSQIFNEDYCRCECPSVQKCDPRFKWDKDKCKCVCNAPLSASMTRCLTTSLYRKYWDINVCDCVCYKSRCTRKGRFMVQDKKTCRCKCSLQSCPPGQRLNKRKCRCE